MASLSPPGFAVTGTGRCGTGYTAAVLRRHGVEAGHENWWTPDPRRVRGGLDSDSSWLALPDIESGAWSGPVLHIVRHPVAVVRSFVGLGFPDQVSIPHEPDLAELPQPAKAVEYWVRWNRRCAAIADLTVPIESFVERLDEVAAAIGRDLNPAKTARVPPTVNHRRRGHVDAAEIWELLAGRAGSFGYEP